MDREIKKQLDDIFYSTDFLSRGYDKLIAEVKRKKLNIPQNIVKFYYDNQQVSQMFKPLFKPHRKKILVFKPFTKIFVDTMFITSSNITLINVVDYFTKYGLIKVFRGHITDSHKAKETIIEFIERVHKMGYTIDNVYTDNGSEFKGEFSKYLKEESINHIYTEAYDKRVTSPIETFNKTIRLMYEKNRAIYGLDITKINELFKNINKVYNNTVHSSLGYTPIEIVKDKEKQELLYKKNRELQREQSKEELLLKVGDYVRIPIEKDIFDKLSPNWSKEVYKIIDYDKTRKRFKVEGIEKYFSPYELQYVDIDNLMGRKLAVKPTLAQGTPSEIQNVILSFLNRQEENKKEEPKEFEKRVTRGKQIDFKALAGVVTREKKNQK